MNGEPTLHARTAADWRAWLDEQTALQRAIWLIIYHKRSPTPSVLVPEAVAQALCFGWIDSHARKRDAESFYLRFTPRRPHRPRGSRFRVGRPALTRPERAAKEMPRV